MRRNSCNVNRFVQILLSVLWYLQYDKLLVSRESEVSIMAKIIALQPYLPVPQEHMPLDNRKPFNCRKNRLRNVCALAELFLSAAMAVCFLIGLIAFFSIL